MEFGFAKSLYRKVISGTGATISRLGLEKKTATGNGNLAIFNLGNAISSKTFAQKMKFYRNPPFTTPLPLALVNGNYHCLCQFALWINLV